MTISDPSPTALLTQLGLSQQTPPNETQWAQLWAALQHLPSEPLGPEAGQTEAGQATSATLAPAPTSDILLMSTDLKGNILKCYAGLEQVLGFTPTITGKPLGELMATAIEKVRLQILLQEVVQSGLPTNTELLFGLPSGEASILTCHVSPQYSANGEMTELLLSCDSATLNISPRFFGRRGFYEALLDALPAPIAIFNAELRYVYCNPTAIRNDKIREWIIGHDDVEYAAYRNFDPEMARKRQHYIQQAIAERQTINYEETLTNPQGEPVYQLRTYTPMFDGENNLLLVIGHGLEITQLKLMQKDLAQLNVDLEKRVSERTAELEILSAKLQYDAFHDPLTGLPNRSLFLHRLAEAIQRANTPDGPQYAVLFLDTDRFKGVNDTLGHLAGDDMLSQLGARLRRTLRSSDTVARLGGDEFAVLLEPLLEPEEAVQVAQRIQQEMRRPMFLQGYDMEVSVSIGVVLGDPEYHTALNVLRDADIAMYRAKGAGRAGYQVFTPEMRRQTVETNMLENDLRSALRRHELRVLFQAVVDLQTQQVTGFEALVRWQHPLRGLLGPQIFMPVAEESSLVVDVDRWVLRHACQQMVEAQQQHPQTAPMHLSINFSARHFSVVGLAHEVSEILRQTGFAPEQLNIEVTEGALLANTETINLNLAELRALGIQLHLDDFGTGYSALSYLQTYPLDTLKIDRSFVGNMIENTGNAELVRTIVSMAKNMHLKVVAEGIETLAQLELLRELGCEYGQGYLFARPLEIQQAWLLTAGRLLG